MTRIDELAKILRVDRRTIVAACKKGNWEATKTWRWIINNPPSLEAAMKPKDVAAIIGVSQQVVTRWCRDKRIKAIKINDSRYGHWRIDYEDGTKLIFSRKFGFRKGS